MRNALSKIKNALTSFALPETFSRRATIVVACAVLAAGFFCGFAVSRMSSAGRGHEPSHAADAHEDKHGEEKGHGETHSDEKKDEHGDEHGASITVSPRALGLLSFSYVPVRRGIFERATTVSGRILSEPQSTASVSAPQAGTVRQCFAEVGMSVRAGDALCLLAPADGSAAIEVTTPISGVILSKFVGHNSSVDRLTVIHTIADLSEFAAVFDVYERDIALIGQGKTIDVRASAFPGRVFTGRITFVSPRVDEESRTIKVRATVKNQDMLLRLGMFVSGTIKSPAHGMRLIVPEEAVQDAGLKKIVFVQSGSNTFVPVDVAVQETSLGTAAVTGELIPGQMVVTAGAPYLRSEFLKGELVDEHKH